MSEAIDGERIGHTDVAEELGDVVKLNWHLVGEVDDDGHGAIVHLGGALYLVEEVLGAEGVECAADVQDGQVLFA